MSGNRRLGTRGSLFGARGNRRGLRRDGNRDSGSTRTLRAEQGEGRGSALLEQARGAMGGLFALVGRAAAHFKRDVAARGPARNERRPSVDQEPASAPRAPADRQRWIRLRILIGALPLLALYPVLAQKAYTLQIKRGKDFRGLAEDQYLREIKLAAPRGTIYDRSGQPLAVSVQVDSAFANPRMVIDAEETARRIGLALDEPPAKIEKRLEGHKFFAWLKRRITPDQSSRLRALGIPGVATTPESRRFYPNRELAGSIIGFAGQDGLGLEGIEKRFDSELKGKPASLRGLRDARGRQILADGLGPTASGAARAAVAGLDIVLTIDRAIQYQAEQVLAETVAKFQAKGAVAVVMDPHTGAILAMAQAPTFDPNQAADAHGSAAPSPLRRKLRGITDVFEPGSTFKVFLMAAGIEAGVTRADEKIDTESGRLKIGKHTIHDTHPHKVLTASEVITKSSNIGAAKIAMRLGKRRLHDYLTRFGFGLKSDVELPGESGGILRPPTKWSEIGMANIAFGQGVAVSALQLTSALSALANGGVLMRPRIVERIVEHGSPQNRSVGAYPPEPRGRVVSAETAKIVTAMMRTVTGKEGTAKQAAMPGYGVAGKTGTAQKADPVSGGYAADSWVSSFVGFVPAFAPRLAIVVIVDEPKGEHLGGAVAAPAFRRIAEEALKYLGVPHSEAITAGRDGKDGEKPASAPTNATAAVAAAASPASPTPAAGAALGSPAAEATGPTAPEPHGADDGADENAGVEPAAVAEDGSIVDGGRMPDFRGLTIREALAAARRAGVGIEVEGSGRAIQQRPAAGAPARRGRVRFGSGAPPITLPSKG